MDKSLLKGATSSSDGNPSGYELKRIADATHASVDACNKLTEFLLYRVKNSNHNVKRRCLIVIKHVALRGRPEFKRSLQRGNEDIKACLQFRGPPDALRGDEPNRRVRECAKEALDAIFSTAAPTTNSVGGARLAGFSGGSGMPSASSSAPAYGSSYDSPAYSSPTGPATRVSAGGMTGFGNYDPRQHQSGGFLSSLKSKITAATTSQAAPAGPPRTGGGPRDYNYATNRGPTAISGHTYGAPTHSPQAPSSSFSSSSSYGNSAGGSRIGGGWGDAPAVSYPPSGATGGRSPAPAPGAQTGTGSGDAGRARTDGTYEKGLVEAITAPGGIRSVPPADKLNQFCFQCRTLDPEIVVPLLLERAGNSNDKIVKKALHVMIALCSAQAVEGHVAQLRAAGARIAALPNSVAPAARSLAAKLAGAVQSAGGAAPEYAPSAPASAPAAAPAPAAPLIDLFGEAPAAAPAAAPAPASGGMDLFAGMSTSGSAAVPPAPPVASAPAPAPAPAAAPAAAEAAPVDLFGGLSVAGSTPAPAPAPAAAAAAASFVPAPAPASGGFFAVSTAPAPAPSGFFGMSSAPAPAPAPAPAAPLAGGLGALAAGPAAPATSYGSPMRAPTMQSYTATGAAISTAMPESTNAPATGFTFGGAPAAPAAGFGSPQQRPRATGFTFAPQQRGSPMGMQAGMMGMQAGMQAQMMGMQAGMMGAQAGMMGAQAGMMGARPGMMMGHPGGMMPAAGMMSMASSGMLSMPASGTGYSTAAAPAPAATDAQFNFVADAMKNM